MTTTYNVRCAHLSVKAPAHWPAHWSRVGDQPVLLPTVIARIAGHVESTKELLSRVTIREKFELLPLYQIAIGFLHMNHLIQFAASLFISQLQAGISCRFDSAVGLKANVVRE
jgi:hypothetical protein